MSHLHRHCGQRAPFAAHSGARSDAISFGRVSLIRDLDKKPRKQLLVKSIVSMCGDQGARVVAEGIETVDELRAVIDAGVHYGQGYLLAKPGPPVPSVVWPEQV